MHLDPAAHLNLPWTTPARSIAERLAGELAHRIVSGETAPGTWLTEVDVAAGHGVSRTPVREALLTLQVWGLVALAPKKGAMVTVPTATERDELLSVRSMLEADVVRRLDAAEAGSREELATHLRAILDRQRATVARPAEFAVLDYAFHAAIIHHEHSGVVAEISRLLGPRLIRLTHLAVASAAGRLDEFADEHTALLGAIEARDPAGFARLIEQHLARGHSGYEVAR
ncbi:GntR family transcriptional regulator [Promicromonospora sp. NPDC052451]|uniref:GntR family transcriptional regulator n=1 Tax=Promicromonospora sp. NPDC052451 TaxID=3364407 RepID=UPI0037CB7A32